MKVGLIRHFKVERGYPDKMVSSNELLSWIKEYDDSPVELKEIDLKEIDWKRCYSSDLPRAVITAENVFEGEVQKMKELREITLAPILPQHVKLPLKLHFLFIRLAWMINHTSQPVSKRELRDTINVVLDKILNANENILIVSHGGIMMFLRKELLRRGFTGPKFNIANNGELYVFTKGSE
ncbi:histidine phosphatase family protein [Sutcliffiella rhizosphaerae]|uniref:Phosphoglycerate mutase n=1 Tax=Sutcliffiella rhizosphaerae TaxID=2880967 RepID=A0ABM8YNP3_9BACI|nr:histidine phosphatase family protein [Sutcliffiella rhizosphaerae]CAG9621595.1 hypothetical protein BACCIP111883_02368 [Sutcliffiella rhizosphaerae]